MSNHATIRTAIVAMLAAIPAMGPVHSYQRYAKAEKDFRALYAAGGPLLGWSVSRKGLWQSSPVLGRWTITQEWEVRGVMALNDAEASELAFDSLIDLAQEAFRADETVLGTVSTTVLGEADDDHAGLQLEESGPVMFCGVLCHGARLSLFTRHYL